jgi:hypothetical protein
MRVKPLHTAPRPVYIHFRSYRHKSMDPDHNIPRRYCSTKQEIHDLDSEATCFGVSPRVRQAGQKQGLVLFPPLKSPCRGALPRHLLLEIHATLFDAGEPIDGIPILKFRARFLMLVGALKRGAPMMALCWVHSVISA